MPRRPDSGTRILVATILLIVILAFAVAGEGIWEHAGQTLPVTR